MLNKVLARFSTHPSCDETFRALDIASAAVHGLGGAAAACFVAALKAACCREGRVFAVLPDEESAQTFFGDIENFIGPGMLALFPERDTSPYEHADSHVEVRSRRIETIDRLERGWSGIVVASIAALHDPATPPGLLPLVSLEIATGQELAFDPFIRMLTDKGFKRERTVTEAGQIAVRGGIVDMFPYGGDEPSRIEFWGDRIESIRTFSVETQRSLLPCDMLRIVPPDEFITEAGIDPADERRLTAIEAAHGISFDRFRAMIDGGERPNGAEQYLHVVFGERASLAAYIRPSDATVLFEPVLCAAALAKRLEHAATVFQNQRMDDPDLPPPEVFYRSPESLMTALERHRLVTVHDIRPPASQVISFNIASSREYGGNLDEVRRDMASAHEKGMAVSVACDNAGQARRLGELLDTADSPFAIDVARISGGFTDPATGTMLLTDHEIFGRRQRRHRYRRFREGTPIPDHRALQLGDFVVHVDYGIGRYMGLKRVAAGGSVTDCLLVRYGGDDKLFVPIDQLKRLKKFTAEEGVVPVVNKLGGTAWERLKEKTRKSIQRLAEDLLKLYAQRKAFPGYAFHADETMLRALEESFVYEETPDQTRAWADVRRDMESDAPMERLICGDVGFGKTEIAMRAAFLAALNNKQVAVLVPTTILAEQHEDTFTERFADFPVRVASLSRFKTKKEQSEILHRLAAGDVDILIGTHRLLSKDVHVRNLGLLIIDEEQRFGVRHKEKIKAFRKTVDVLSMSATPIPRTLNMSLLGARDISFINTPPPDRYSVHTEVIPFEEHYLVDAIMHEIDRGGQVFFVHNRVQSIDSMAAYLRRIMPSVSFCVAHGQMPERELEKHMRDFYHGVYQVLVSTMIIENGLDIPSVNTIIVNRADTFGLSQLYQLRGRVGRSSVRAFAYMLVPPKIPLTPIARKRLRTIEELTELGSGFNVAMRDLEYRGAGNILGTQQSGFISAIGFDLYTELLHETIANLRGETVERAPEVELRWTGESFIPESYVEEGQERVQLYRRLSETTNASQVDDIEHELVDRFGRPPAPVENILNAAAIRHYAGRLSVSEIIVGEGVAQLVIPESIEVSRETVEGLIKKSPAKLQFAFNGGMQVTFTVPPDPAAGLLEVKKVLQALAD